MPCACNGGAAQETARREPQYEVTFTNGRTEKVSGEMAARVLQTQGGFGTKIRKLD
jgi:hypothetical protein